MRQPAFDISLAVAFFEVVAFVVGFFGLGEAEFDFEAVFGKIHGDRDKGQAFFLGFFGEFNNFGFVHEQFSIPSGTGGLELIRAGIG